MEFRKGFTQVGSSLAENIRLVLKRLIVTNTLSPYGTKYVTSINGFIVQAPGVISMGKATYRGFCKGFHSGRPLLN